MQNTDVLLTILCITVAPACSGQQARLLHPTGGDSFALFADGTSRPSSLPHCEGESDARYACFAASASERARSQELSAVLVYVDAEGTRSLTETDHEQTAPVSVRTRFPIASMTKMFTAMATLALADQGVVDLEVPVASYLSELSPTQGPGAATLAQLLSHTAGVSPNVDLCARGDETIDELVSTYAHSPLWSPPGTLYNYSNLGYTFVGAVLQRSTRTAYPELLQEQVLAPLGLSEARFEREAVSVRGTAVPGVPVSVHCPATWPAGGLGLTGEELAHFLKLVTSPAAFPLGEPLLQTLIAPRVSTGARDDELYGFGVSQFSIGHTLFYNHGGALHEFASFIAWSPERQAGAAAVVNERTPWARAAVAGVLSTMSELPGDWSPRPSAQHALSSYAGTYVDRHAGLGTVRVSLEDAHLAVDYLAERPRLLPVSFRFVFEGGAAVPRWVVTEVGVGERVDEAAEASAKPQAKRCAAHPRSI